MKLDEMDPTLMLHPALNEMIHLSAAYHEGLSRRTRLNRARMSATCFYHNILAEAFDEAAKVRMIGGKRGKPGYPKRGYLGNVEIEYLPERAAWKVTLTNGGLRRKNARLPYKVREILYVRRLGGIHVVDDEFEER